MNFRTYSVILMLIFQGITELQSDMKLQADIVYTLITITGMR